jgi:archaeal flagellar protein FlaJ
MKLRKMHWFGIAGAIFLLAIDLIFFYKNDKVLLFLAGIAIGTAALPFVISLTIDNKKEQKKNEMFLEFTRNLAEAVAAGTPVSKAIINTKKKNYGVLDEHVKKLANQIEMGISVQMALQTFAKDTGSAMIKRATALINEAERSGGEIDYILESTAKSISEVEKLKKERKSTIYNIVVQGYIIFFTFIGIILIMEMKILPLTTGMSGIGQLGGFQVQNINAVVGQNIQKFSYEDFAQPLLYLLIAQGFFMGLIIGKISEGSVKSGIKHSLILVTVAFLVSGGARLFFMP